MRIALLVVLLSAAAFAAPAPRDEIEARTADFKAAVPAARGVVSPPASGREHAAAALQAAKIYDEWLPQDFRKASGTGQGLQWYKLAFQETALMDRETTRLLKNCAIFRGERGALAASRAVNDSARRFLTFIDETPWPEPLRLPLTTDLRQAHLRTMGRWKIYTACLSSKAASRLP